LIAGFNGHQIPPELRSLAKEFGLGGVILFARNIGEPEQVAELCFEASRLSADLPPWVSVDQEGGRVARLKARMHEVSGSDKAPNASALASNISHALVVTLVGVAISARPVVGSAGSACMRRRGHNRHGARRSAE
jgi:beta-glucosidase-like glycosyl hydrolase